MQVILQKQIRVIKYFFIEKINMANKQRLESIVVSRSVTSDFNQAKTEWRLLNIEYSSTTNTCICDHPIHKLCWIENKHNKNKLLVGSTCVTKFINKNLLVDKLFVALDKLNRSPDDGCPKILINFSYTQGYINDWEKSFIESLGSRYGVNLTQKQLEHRKKIHTKILENTGYRKKLQMIKSKPILKNKKILPYKK